MGDAAARGTSGGTSDSSVEQRAKIEGFVDWFGYSSLANGWMFCGWLSKDFQIEEASLIRAVFQHRTIETDHIAVSFTREDLADRGCGTLVFILTPQDEALGKFLGMEITFGSKAFLVRPTEGVKQLLPGRVDIVARGNLAKAPQGTLRKEFSALISHSGYGTMRPAFNLLSGGVKFVCYHNGARGWLIQGWVTRSWNDDFEPSEITLHFTRGEVTAQNTLVLFRERADLKDHSVAFLMYVPSPARSLGKILSVELQQNGIVSTISGSGAEWTFETPSSLEHLAPGAPPSALRDAFSSLVARKPPNHEGGLAGLTDLVMLHVDEVIACSPAGAIIFGWLLVRPGIIEGMTLHTGSNSVEIEVRNIVPLRRKDVIQTVGVKYGFEEERCGFLVFAAEAEAFDGDAFIEILTKRGEIAYLRLPAPRLGGMAAIQRTLRDLDGSYGELREIFDKVVGPAVTRLNHARIAHEPNVTELEFGSVSPTPRFSIVVPLFARIDFVEAQLALMSLNDAARSYEIIYVLDDPPLRPDAVRLFESVYQRFRIPFRALLLDQNRGFAAASNAGFRRAAAPYTCFLNSDVFPRTVDWLERLATRLDMNPDLGAVGPVLLYEDLTVQHEGMSYRRLPQLGNWLFCDHPGKGMLPQAHGGLHRKIAITGACMLLRSSTARELGGLDEAYITDFEDADLCMKLHDRGLSCAVDFEVELYHLERKSHPATVQSWRRNLVYYNAWLHNTRWESAIVNHPLFSGASQSAPGTP